MLLCHMELRLCRARDELTISESQTGSPNCCPHLRSCEAMSLEVVVSPAQGDHVSGLLQKAHRMAQPCVQTRGCKQGGVDDSVC